MKQALLGLVFLTLGVCGCVSHKAEAQLRKNGYIRLEAVPADAMAEASLIDRAFFTFIIENINRHKNSPESLDKFISKIRGVLDDKTIPWSTLRESMKEEDQMFYFEYSDKNYSDTGILVLRDRQIVFRHWWTNSLNHRSQTEGSYPDFPSNMNFDHLTQPMESE